MSIGEKIKEARKAAGLTQMELAKKTRLSRSYIGDIEKDRYNPSLSTLELIAKATDTSLSALVRNEEQSTTPTDHYDTISPHSKRDLNDLAKFLNKSEVMFDGDTYNLSEEDQQKLRNALEFVFWDAKRQNKRKKD
jgi:immunity repressor protein